MVDYHRQYSKQKRKMALRQPFVMGGRGNGVSQAGGGLYYFFFFDAPTETGYQAFYAEERNFEEDGVSGVCRDACCHAKGR